MINFFIRRPVFAGVISIVLTLIGLIAIPTLPIEQYPELSAPTVSVSATYVGASAEVVETAVTIPLEQELNGVEGMRYISSSSTNEGRSSITITFEPGRDLEVAAVDVQNRVSRAAARLPAQVNQTGIVVSKSNGQNLASFGLYTDDDRYDPAFLSNYADVNIKDAIKRIPGVADVQIYGERKFSMRLWLDPTQLAARNLTGQDVARALQEQNLQVAAGQIGAMPTRDDQPFQMAVRARGRLLETTEFEDIVVHRAPDGTVVRLKDIGRAELGAESYSGMLRFNGHPGVGLGISQLQSANALEVRDAVIAELDRLSANFPPGLKYESSNDTTLAVRASVNEVLRTLIEAIILVVLVIFLFLHGWRSVLIVALTLPVSLLGTFAFVKLFGFSINTLTLFGLTLATGLVVDDAIVVIENIERLMVEKGYSARKAAREGMKEVAGAVVAISIVLVAVFLPVAFFPGTTGRIYQQFALTIAASVLLSTICALTLTPALSALLLKHHHGEKWILFRWIDRGLDAFRNGYGGLLRRMLKYPWAIVLAFLVLLAGTVQLFRTVPTGFIPDEDQGYMMIVVQGPEGQGLGKTEEILKKIEVILEQQPEIRSMFLIGGFSFSGSGPNHATAFINLRPWEERTEPHQSVAAMVERLRGPLSKIGEARVMPFQPPAIRGVGTLGGFQFIVEDTTGELELFELADAVGTLTSAAAEVDTLRGVYSSFNADTPLLDVEVDRQLAKSMGVSIDQIYATLQLYMGSQYVNDFNFASRTYRVYLQAEQQFRDSPKDIGTFYVRSGTGEMIPLESLVKVTPVTSAQVIRRYNLFRSAEVNGQPAPGVSSGQALERMEQLAQEVLPQGVIGEWTGASLEQKASGAQTLIIFGLGILFVYLVLSAQYESFSLPLVVILSVPLAILGALGFQALRGLPNDVFCQLGLVMLVGLASKNAILIVEFAEQLRESGHSVVDAAIEAAEVRLRPILMTSIAFLLGVLPLVIASGAGAAARNSLGTAVFGGMFVSTFVNLIFIPGLYVVIMGLTGASKRATDEDGEDEAPAPAGQPG